MFNIEYGTHLASASKYLEITMLERHAQTLICLNCPYYMAIGFSLQAYCCCFSLASDIPTDREFKIILFLFQMNNHSLLY